MGSNRPDTHSGSDNAQRMGEIAPDAPSNLSLDWWIKAVDEQLSICRSLEDIADSLPANINRQKCIHAARAIGPLIKNIHHFEEHVLFPQIAAKFPENSDCAKTIERLKFEHFSDECFAEELIERLLQLGADTAEINMEATGYMLRGFFEGIKRHIAFEREHLLVCFDHQDKHQI